MSDGKNGEKPAPGTDPAGDDVRPGQGGRNLLVALSLVAGLACEIVTSGTVVQKSYTPAWVDWVQTCDRYARDGYTCLHYTFIPEYMPASYEFKVRDDMEDKPVNDRDTGWIDVPSDDYSRYKVGEKYP